MKSLASRLFLLYWLISCAGKCEEKKMLKGEKRTSCENSAKMLFGYK